MGDRREKLRGLRLGRCTQVMTDSFGQQGQQRQKPPKRMRPQLRHDRSFATQTTSTIADREVALLHMSGPSLQCWVGPVANAHVLFKLIWKDQKDQMEDVIRRMRFYIHAGIL